MEDKLGWEEKRAYLVQSLFRDIPMTSFASEEDEPPPVVLEPCSPLPELNIEIVPKRHTDDEPEEFYVDLEIKMKKFYRKLFYNEDCCSSEEMNELSQYITCYNSDSSDSEDYDVEKNAFAYNNKNIKSSDFENLNIDNFDTKCVESKNEARVVRDEIKPSIEKSASSAECSADFQQMTCVAEVHHKDADTDEAESILDEAEKSKSSILLCSMQTRAPEQSAGATDADQCDLDDDATDDGKNRKPICEDTIIDPVTPISDKDASHLSVDIMRSNDVRRRSIYSIRLSGHSSASSPLEVEFERSRVSNFNLDLLQISTLNNLTKLEDSMQISQNDESKFQLSNDSDPLPNKSTEEKDNDEHDTLSKVSSNMFDKATNVMSSTMKPKHMPAVNYNLSSISEEDESEYTDDEQEEVANTNNKFGAVIDNKVPVSEDSERVNESSDDEYDTYDVETIYDSDTDIEKISARKASTTRGTNEKLKYCRDKSIPLHEIVNTMEQSNFLPATSTPISRMAITQSVVEESDSVDELNIARISSPSNTKGTKRTLQELSRREFSQESKKAKLIDVGVQATDDNLDWNDLKNIFFVGIPRIYKLCSCKNHICER